MHFLLSDIASGRTCVHTQGAQFSQIQKSISEYCVLVFEQARARDSYHDELYFLSYSNLCNRINAEVMATAMKAVTALFLIFFSSTLFISNMLFTIKVDFYDAQKNKKIEMRKKSFIFYVLQQTFYGRHCSTVPHTQTHTPNKTNIHMELPQYICTLV